MFVIIVEIMETAKIPTHIWATIVLATISIFLIAVVKEQINERFKEKMFMPVPIDIIVVSSVTFLSLFLNKLILYNTYILLKGYSRYAFFIPFQF
jgi:hypothetical protein